MNKANYIYIDDYKDSSVEAIIDGLKDTDIINITYKPVSDFSTMITLFEKELKNFDGILLDLRLDRNPDVNVKFTATGLAQELRNRSAANEGIKDVPIVLCSTDKNIREYYNRDNTSHDLFDYKFVKETGSDHIKLAKKLQSLANGYEQLKTSKGDLNEILSRDIKALDPRMLGKFTDIESRYPIHEYSQHFLKEVIRKPGPLVQEKLLAARLGVDIERSIDWGDLISKFFGESKYTGVFSDAWDRWWMDLVLERFKLLTGKRLASLNAQQRVSSLIDATNLKKITPAEPIDKSVSSTFWTICEYFKKPLDPLEGFKIHYIKEPKPWQDQMYLSFEAAAERLGLKDGLKVNTQEAERLALMKEKFKKR